MNYESSTPQCGSKNGEERYFVHLSDFNYHDTLKSFTFYKVKCIRRWYDKENKKYAIDAIVLEEYIEKGMKGRKTIIDSNWHLQKTKEDAQRLLIILAMNYGQNLSYEERPPL